MVLKLILKFLLFVMCVNNCFAIDLCVFFGNCPNNNNNNRNNNPNFNFNARNDPGPDFVNVDADWIEPRNSGSGVLYHFGSGLGPTDWYAADSYCSDKGGYLAEPSSEEEHSFIVAKARTYPNANWWIGLRSMEDCQCKGNSNLDANGRSLEATRSTFEASVDFDSLSDRSAQLSPVKTICPPGFEKICVSPTWRWSYSTQKMGFSKWNARTGEPNSNQENCVALWFEYEYNWSDWTCTTANAGPHPFKPICQKDKPLAESNPGGKRDVDSRYQQKTENGIIINSEVKKIDQNFFDEENIFDKNELDSDDKAIHCMEYGVIYRSHNTDKLSSIFQVDSAELCRQYCAEEPTCRFWTWFARREKCVLKSGLRKTGFRLLKSAAVSGTMLNNCRPDEIPTPKSSNFRFSSKFKF